MLKNIKRIIAAFLSLVMLVGVFHSPIVAQAADTAEATGR